MRTRFTVAVATLLALIASLLVFLQPAEAAVGFRISGGRLLDANGNQFIMRGTSHAHTWFPTQTSSFANIKSLGANAVRVVLSGGRWQPANGPSDVANVITLCRQNRLICVLENHDTTGFGEQGGAVSLDQAVNYWLSLQSVLTGQENYVIINIGNEPYGNNNTSAWTAATTAAIGRLRNAGLDHTIMVDAPNWGQDWQFVMRDNATTVFNSDVDRNTIFSIHMYGVFDTAAEVSDYLQRFQTAGLPIVIGEFGHMHSDGDPNEDAIMSNAVSRGIGYLGWSWSGNSGGVEYLDMVNGFNVNSLTPWGQRIFNGANGIRETAREASVFGGGTTTTSGGSTTTTTVGSTTTTIASTTTTTPGGTRGCRVAYTASNWGGGNGFTAGVTITNTGTAAVNGWNLVWSYANGQRVTQMWSATYTQPAATVTATNVDYNSTIAPNGGSVNFGFNGSWNGTTNANPTAFALNGSACSTG